ncbi:MAG: 2-oxo-4-hydroxy-4-carboxy-5-ureidoimidazoline decarboxylase [Actinomycetota bacterium]|nr:2-oxo-4-hydroxy-4-carboxy-5-ureidoimidazoline decarboxylase [Actinomycetota bacterium]
MSELSHFNQAPVHTLRPRLFSLTAVDAWADGLLDGRPYDDLDAVLATSDAIVSELDESQIDAALAGHPRIGERADGPDEKSAARSAKEQSAMSRADADVQDAVTRGNADYEKRFGRIYLVAAAGRSADELLSLLRQRLHNDPVTELEVVRQELARISRVRLTNELQDQPEER